MTEAIVVLGAAQYDGEPSPVLAARLDRALELYVAGTAPIVVVTGGNQPGDRTTEAKSGYDYLRAKGIPDEALLLEVQGHNTYESLAATSRFLAEKGIDQVIVVSDRSHALRAKLTANEVGLDATVAASDNGGAFGAVVREGAAVSVGRVISFRRLAQL